MKYGAIIAQAWDTIKRSKLLWLLGLIQLLSFYADVRLGNTDVLLCLSLWLSLLSILMTLFFDIGTILFTDKFLNGENPALKDIWVEFKSLFWRQIGLTLVVLIPCGLVFLCTMGALALFYNGINVTVDDPNLRMTIALLVCSPVLGGFFAFSRYGLIVHNMGVFKSVGHGLQVFLLNWYRYLFLSTLVLVPVILFYLVLWIIYVTSGNTLPLLDAFSKTLSIFPVQLASRVLSCMTSLSLSVSILIAYKQFIKEYDYPALRQAAPNQ